MKEGKALRRQIKDTLLFLGFFLLAGFLHSTDPDPNYFLVSASCCAEYLIYAGLILFWVHSVRQRLLPTRAKGYLLAAACLMLLFIAAQFTKYRVSVTPGMARYCWYVYYLPIILIPTLFLMTCFSLVRGSDRRKPDEFFLLLPSGLLALGILTNDLHRKAFQPVAGILHNQAFRPNEGIRGLIGSPGTYTRGFLYYAAYGWAGAVMVAGIFILIAACRKHGSWKKALWPLFFLDMIPFLIAVFERVPKNSLPITYEWPEGFVFCMICVFEACIRNRLIASNMNYPGFFSQMNLPILITDREMKPAYRTLNPPEATPEQLKRSLAVPVYLTADTRLSGVEIQAGYAFRTEDESVLNRLNEELREAIELLQQENEVLERERKVNAELAGIEERSQLYRNAAREIYPVQKKIAEILENAEPNTPSFRPALEKALALTAYVKRKANFVLVEAERETITAEELASAMAESSHYLRYCGLNAVAEVETEEALPCRSAIAVYDCFETVAEQLLGKTSDLFVRLRDNEFLVIADYGDSLDLSGNPFPVRTSREDGQTILRFDLTGGGAV